MVTKRLTPQPHLGCFASSYMELWRADGGKDDWVCVYDLCLQSPSLGNWDLTAYYSPSRHLTVFGNGWHGVPPRISKREPTDRQVQAWAERHGTPCIYEQRRAAAERAGAAYDARSKKTQAWFKKHGANWVFVAYRIGDVRFSTTTIIGIHDIWWCLQNKSPTLQRAVLVKIKVGKEGRIKQFAKDWLEQNPEYSGV